MISKLFRRQKHQQPITVVSGLPRSGTSMMMQMLVAGGMPVLTDHNRQRDTHNPRGYYEYEPVKRLHLGEHEWLANARGSAVKIISPLLAYLPSDYPYNVIFMQRDLNEILASQKIMRGENDLFNTVQLAHEYTQHLETITNWLAEQPHIAVQTIAYQAAIGDPAGCAEQVNQFLGRQLDTVQMQQVVDLRLYRQRNR